MPRFFKKMKKRKRGYDRLGNKVVWNKDAAVKKIKLHNEQFSTYFQHPPTKKTNKKQSGESMETHNPCTSQYEVGFVMSSVLVRLHHHSVKPKLDQTHTNTNLALHLGQSAASRGHMRRRPYHRGSHWKWMTPNLHSIPAPFWQQSSEDSSVVRHTITTVYAVYALQCLRSVTAPANWKASGENMQEVYFCWMHKT